MKKRKVSCVYTYEEIQQEIDYFHSNEIEKQRQKMRKTIEEEIKQELEAKILIGDDKLKALLHKKSKNAYIRKEALRVLKLKP